MYGIYPNVLSIFPITEFERRGSVVRSGREAEHIWEEVTSDMMSEDEEEGNGYVRYPHPIILKD